MRLVCLAYMLCALTLLGCGSSSGPSSASGSANSPIDTDDLTSSEEQDYLRLLRSLDAPCGDMSIAACLEGVDCGGCVPAAKFVASAIRSGRAMSQVQAAYRVRFDPGHEQTIDTTGAPSKGAANAPVTIVEFADYQCPFCAVAMPMLESIVEAHQPNVRLIFMHYPLGSHKQAELAARAAVAAQQQGKFWQLNKVMFENQQALSREDLIRHARSIGLDTARFEADLDHPKTASAVAQSKQVGEELGIRGTPSLFINGRPLDTELFDFSKQQLTEWIEAEVAIKKGQAARESN